MKLNAENKISKTTSEKPVSLSPLSLKKALEGLLKVESKESKENESKVENKQD
jgi:hypothetical protein